MTNLDTIPTLEAMPVDGCTDQWKVWCQYCETFHFHGAIDGHRVAHCHTDSSPYKRSGYIIVGPVSTHVRCQSSAGTKPMTGLATKGKP
jgi:hypothetical protein